ncbi:MAG: hypothetical protein MHMPM18_003972 [Marteilia pararefringens]
MQSVQIVLSRNRARSIPMPLACYCCATCCTGLVLLIFSNVSIISHHILDQIHNYQNMATRKDEKFDAPASPKNSLATIDKIIVAILRRDNQSLRSIWYNLLERFKQQANRQLIGMRAVNMRINVGRVKFDDSVEKLKGVKIPDSLPDNVTFVQLLSATYQVNIFPNL